MTHTNTPHSLDMPAQTLPYGLALIEAFAKNIPIYLYDPTGEGLTDFLPLAAGITQIEKLTDAYRLILEAQTALWIVRLQPDDANGVRLSDMLAVTETRQIIIHDDSCGTAYLRPTHPVATRHRNAA